MALSAAVEPMLMREIRATITTVVDMAWTGILKPSDTFDNQFEPGNP